jgi:hypothetical protein
MAEPCELQSLGMFGKFAEPMTCIAIELASSPLIFTSAVSTAPQVIPLAKAAHSAMGLLLELVCAGNEIESAEDKILRPEEPVSTRIPLIVWQLEVLPWAQTVTLVKAPSAMPTGPPLTESDCTLEPEVGPEPLFAAPHPNISMEEATSPMERKIRKGFSLIGSPRVEFQRASSGEGRLSPSMTPWDLPFPPQDPARE